MSSAASAGAVLSFYFLLGRSVAALRQFPTPHGELAYIAVGLAVAGSGGTALSYLMRVNGSRVAVKVSVKMQELLFARRTSQEISQAALDPSARAISSILYDIEIVPQYLVNAVTAASGSVVTGSALIGAIIYFDYSMLVPLLALGICLIPLRRIQATMRSALIARMSSVAALQIFMHERLSLAAIKFSRNYKLEQLFGREFTTRARQVQQQSYTLQRATALSVLVTGMANAALVVVVLTFANSSSLGRSYGSTADLVLLILSAPMLVQIIQDASNFIFWLSTAAVVVDFLQLNSASVGRRPDQSRLAVSAQAPAVGTRQNIAITVTDLRFEYRHAHLGEVVDVVRGMTFDVVRGESLAIAGPVGCGKSTVAMLLAGLLPPSSGTVAVTGTNPQRAGVAVRLVDDRDCFSAGSISDNLKVVDSSLTLKRMVQICEAVGLHSFVSQLPRGYQTGVGEQGAYLSSGQRQLLAIARAVVAQPEVLILDEATTALDAAAEIRAIRGIREHLDCSIVLIAHRLSSVTRMDRIVVIDDGQVAGVGDHQELLATCRAYRQLCELQMI